MPDVQGPTHLVQNATRQALNIPELQQLIFKYLLVFEDESPWPLALQSDLLAVVTTCKSFAHAALPIKWERVPHLDALTHIFVANNAAKRSVGQYGWNYIEGFDRPSVVNRFLFYANMVRQLRVQQHNLGVLSNASGVTLDARMYQGLQMIISSETQHTYPLPRLKLLEFEMKNMRDLSLFEFVMTSAPALRSLRIRAEFEQPLEEFIDARQCQFFLLLGTVTRTLKRLELDSCLWTALMGVNVARFMEKFLAEADLTSVSVPEAVINRLERTAQLARMPNLRDLVLLPGDETLVHAALPRTTKPTFLALKYLSGDMRTLNKFLNTQPQWKGLEEIKILERNFDGAVGSVTHLHTFFEAVGESCPDIRILDCYVELHDSTNNAPPSKSFVRPLLPCKQLRTIRVEVDVAVEDDHPDDIPEYLNPTDDEWRLVSKSWPEIREIWYGALSTRRYIFSPAPRATFNSLLHLIKNCPKLGQLALPLDATLNGVKKEDIPSASCLFELQLHNAWIEANDEAKTVAVDLLDTLFPHQTHHTVVDLRLPSVELPEDMDPAEAERIPPPSTADYIRFAMWLSVVGDLRRRRTDATRFYHFH